MAPLTHDNGGHPPFIEPRCKACRHSRRDQIDIALARGESYVRISEDFGVPYRSLANHRRKHLDFDNPTIKRVVEAQIAAAHKNRELGVELSIKRRVILDICLATACNAIAEGTPLAVNL